MNKYQEALNAIGDTLTYYMVRKDLALLPSDNEIYDAMATLRKFVDKADSKHEEMTASEMFEALGYKLYEDDIAIVFENNQGDVIAFTYKDKELVVQPTNISKSISMAELKSINMKIKELEWI